MTVNVGSRRTGHISAQ